MEDFIKNSVLNENEDVLDEGIDMDSDDDSVETEEDEDEEQEEY